MKIYYNPYKKAMLAITIAITLSACGSGSNDDSPDGNTDTQGNGGTENSSSILNSLPSDLKDNNSFYKSDGYDQINVQEVYVRTAPGDGVCNNDDTSGCTLADVISDTDSTDDFKPKVPVHFSSSDYADDSLPANAKMKQRGDSSRLAELKSFAITLDDDLPLWRQEKRLQLNKHPYDQERIRNKLAFDLMRDIDHLFSLRTQFVNMKVEDSGTVEDYGLFTHVEYAKKDYLIQRGLDADSPLYKAVNFGFDYDIVEQRFALNENGAPVDEDQFERNLEIKRGKNHLPLITMLKQLFDPNTDKAALLDSSFNENNIVTWLAVNILLGNKDTVLENYYLLNPLDSNRFYLLPWDYDGAFKTAGSPDDFTGEEHRTRRLNYGISRWWRSRLIRTWLKQDGSLELLSARIKELRESALSDENINNLVEAYKPVVESYLMSAPDLDYLEGDNPENKLAEWNAHTSEMAGRVGTNFQNYLNQPGWPMTFWLVDATVSDNQATLRWEPSWDFENDTLIYSLEVADNPEFNNPQVVEFAIPHTIAADSYINYTLDTTQLASGTWYWRANVHEKEQPDVAWRPATNRLTVNGQHFYGVRTFTLP